MTDKVLANLLCSALVETMRSSGIKYYQVTTKPVSMSGGTVRVDILVTADVTTVRELASAVKSGEMCTCSMNQIMGKGCTCGGA